MTAKIKRGCVRIYTDAPSLSPAVTEHCMNDI